MSGPSQLPANAWNTLSIAINKQQQQQKQDKTSTSPPPRNANIYTPLTSEDDIRLIHLFPGAFHSELDLALVTYGADEAPAYEALSYVWGAAAAVQKTALVNGEAFRIGTNLEAALRYLRDEREGRTLWVDALCIDQGNVRERNQQVNRMRAIYAGAERSVIWMGEEGDGSERVFDAVEVMSR